MSMPHNDALARLAELISLTEEASPDLDDLLEELISEIPCEHAPDIDKHKLETSTQSPAIVFVEGVSVPQGCAHAALEEVANKEDTLYLCGPNGSLLNLSKLK